MVQVGSALGSIHVGEPPATNPRRGITLAGIFLAGAGTRLRHGARMMPQCSQWLCWPAIGAVGGLARFGEHIEWAELSLHSRRGTDRPPARMARPAVLDSFSHFPHINTRFVHIYRRQVPARRPNQLAPEIMSVSSEGFVSIASTRIRCWG